MQNKSQKVCFFILIERIYGGIAIISVTFLRLFEEYVAVLSLHVRDLQPIQPFLCEVSADANCIINVMWEV